MQIRPSPGPISLAITRSICSGSRKNRPNLGPALNAVIEVNPDCKNVARAMDDEERKAKGARGAAAWASGFNQRQIDTHDSDDGRRRGALALMGSMRRGMRLCAEIARRRGAVLLGEEQFERVGEFSRRSIDEWMELGRGGLTKQSLCAG